MKNTVFKTAEVIVIVLLFTGVGMVSGFINHSQIYSHQLPNNELCIGKRIEKQSYDMIPVSRGLLGQDPLINEIIQQIDEHNIYRSVYTLQNFTTRRYGTSGNIAASTWLYNTLNNISGLTVEYHDGTYRNVIATQLGHDNTSTSIYMVGAHYDTADLSFAPGATDNGAGVAIVLEFARILSQYTFNHTIMYAFWNAEEGGAGNLGSRVFTDYAIAHNLNIELYINYDSSCYDPDNHFILDIISNSQSQWVSEMMMQHNSLYNINFTLTYNIHTSCASDHIPFWEKGYTAVTTHSETHGFAHTQYDTVDKVNTLYAKKNGQLGMSVIANLSDVQYQNENFPPNKPSNPSPANGSTNVSRNADLTWVGGDPDGDVVTYDVYFGTRSPPEKVVANQSGLTYDPGVMNHSTLYYWMIVAWDSKQASTVGDQWCFTTIQNPPIQKIFIFGFYTNLTEEDGSITIKAVNLRVVFLDPLQFFHYISGETVTFLKNNFKGIVFPRFIIGFS